MLLPRKAFGIVARHNNTESGDDIVEKTSTVRGLIAAVIVCSVWGCVTTVETPETSFNPAPASSFSSYSQIELNPVQFDPGLPSSSANQAALQKIQENVDAEIGSTLEQWNSSPSATSNGRLVIEPVITEMKFVGGATRFFAGALAGSSAVVMKVRIYDSESGDTIAEPEFYQRAAAMGGAYTIGVTDNLMLVRIANLLVEYLKSNYENAVGGRTGA